MPQNPKLQKLRQKYPQYADLDDLTLARKVVERYPQYEADFADLLGKGGPGKAEDQPGYGQRADIFKRELAKQPIFQSGQRLNEAVSQIPERPVAGGLNVLNSLLQAGAAPFTAGEQALRQVPGGGGVADVLTFPFQKIAEGVQGAENVIGQSLDALRGTPFSVPNPKTPEAEALSGVNQAVAQMLPLGVRGPKTAKPSDFLIKDMPRKIEAPPELKNAGELQGMTEKAVATGKSFTTEQAGQRWGSRESLAQDFKKAIDEKNLESAKDIALEMQRSREEVEGYIAQKQGREHRAMRPEEIDQFFKEEAQGDPVAKITQIIKEAKPVRGETERLYTQERRKRAAQLSEVLKNPEGEATLYKALATQKGELPKATFESAKPKLTEQDIKTLFDRITTTKELQSYETLSALNSFRDILEGRRVPGRYELGLLEKVFGEEFVGAVLEKRNLGEKFLENALDVGNLPRSLMAGYDMSNPFRQSILFTMGRGFRDPKLVKDAFREQFSSFAKEENFKASQADIRSRPNAPLYEESGLYLAEMGGRALELTKREEAFMSRLATKIPGVKHSNRAYVAYGNRIRADVFDKLTDKFKKLGYSPENNPEIWKALADYVNKATGRGNLGKYGERIAPLLNTIGFSPRNIAAKLELLNPLYYKKLPKPVRIEAMKDMLTFATVGTTLLTLAKTAGADVELDPRSSDFGKIKIGNTRLDPWGGFQQWIRFGAQLISGERKSTTTGQVRKISKDVFPFESRGDLLLSFAGQKLSPQASLIADLLRGETAIGEPLTFNKVVLERMTPMYLQDIGEAAEELGIAGAVGVSIPGFFGVGVQTYKPRNTGIAPADKTFTPFR